MEQLMKNSVKMCCVIDLHFPLTNSTWQNSKFLVSGVISPVRSADLPCTQFSRWSPPCWPTPDRAWGPSTRRGCRRSCWPEGRRRSGRETGCRRSSGRIGLRRIPRTEPRRDGRRTGDSEMYSQCRESGSPRSSTRVRPHLAGCFKEDLVVVADHGPPLHHGILEITPSIFQTQIMAFRHGSPYPKELFGELPLIAPQGGRTFVGPGLQILKAHVEDATAVKTAVPVQRGGQVEPRLRRNVGKV